MLTKVFRPMMVYGCSIVYMSSISAFARSHDHVYASSEGTGYSFAKSVAREFGPRVRVNVVAPCLTKSMGMFEVMANVQRNKYAGEYPEETCFANGHRKPSGVPLPQLGQPHDGYLS